MHSADQLALQSDNDDEDSKPPAAPSARVERQLQSQTAASAGTGLSTEEAADHASKQEEMDPFTSSCLGSEGLCGVGEIDDPDLFCDSFFDDDVPRLLHVLWIDEGKRRDPRRSNELLEQAASECAAGVCAFTVSGYFIDEGYTLALSREWDLVVVHVQGEQAASFAGRSASWQVSLGLLRNLCVQKGYPYPTVVGIYCPYFAEAAEPTLKQLKEEALIEDFCFYPNNDMELNALLERFLISWDHNHRPRARHASVSSDTTCATAEFLWDEPCTDDVYLGPPPPAAPSAADASAASQSSFGRGPGDFSHFQQPDDALLGCEQSWQPFSGQCVVGAPACPAPVYGGAGPSVTIRPMPSFGSLAISQGMSRQQRAQRVQRAPRKVAPKPS